MTPARILLKGTSGSGKTTLGRILAARLDAPVVELDGLNHGPNWVGASSEELRAKVQSALATHDRWIVEGNYDRKLGSLLLDQADVIVWLDLPLHIKLLRLARRTWRRIRDREALWNGNRESLRTAFVGWDALFAWTVRAHLRQRREWPALFAGRNVVRLQSDAAVADWLRAL